MKAADLRRWEKAFNALDDDLGVKVAARRSTLSESTIYRFLRGDQTSSGLEAAFQLGRQMIGDQVLAKPLSPEATKALDDFAYFRYRYFGRKSMPWQERAAYDVLRFLQTKDREYVVNNEPPGSGKSTLFTNDVPCWLIARDRTIRIMVGSRTERQARQYVLRIKRSLERDAPMRAPADSMEAGIAWDAVAVLQDDYGAFKPEGRSELWRAEALVARQLDGTSLDDKEPTVSAWGQDSGFLGGRFDLVIWDDLVDRKNTRGFDAQENIREWYSTEAETRLEPGGVMLMQGQRMAHNDLYRYALDQKKLDGSTKYRHIVYPAHDDDNCRGHDDDETTTPLPWPDGCLLDPYRLPFKMLETIKYNNPRAYDVQYQQRDGDLTGGLIEPAWITGGPDSDGFNAPGCLDLERSLGEIPAHLRGDKSWSFITVDPSPREWWGIIWWLYDPATNLRYVIDIKRARMEAEEFLTVDMSRFAVGQSAYSGLLENWRIRSNDLNVPLKYVIVEINAAQRWLIQQPYVQTWMEATDVRIVGHTTHINKQDPKYGLESIAGLFRQGMIRLPWKGVQAKIVVNELTREGYVYNGQNDDTTDLLMSTWFGKLAVENLYSPNRQMASYVMHRPEYMGGYGRGIPGYAASVALGR